MITKFYKWMAAGTVTSLLLATLAVVPVSAQSSSGDGQGSGQDQSQGQGMNQNSNGQNQSGQNQSGQSQGSCAAFAQSMGQGMNQSNNQNGNNQSNNQNGQNGNNGQAAVGTSPGNAATPMADCWLSIGPGQKQWYKFHVGARSNKGDENNNFDNANGVDDSDAAIAQLTMDTQGCIAFEIWTQERLNAAQNGVKDNDKLLGPVGAGSPEFVINKNDDSSSDNNSSSSNNNSSSANSDKNLNRARLLWRGGSTVREDFLLVVRNLRSDFACSYRLSVAGPTVSFPGGNNGSNNATGSNNGSNGNNNNGNNGGNNGSNNNGGSNSNNNNG